MWPKAVVDPHVLQESVDRAINRKAKPATNASRSAPPPSRLYLQYLFRCSRSGCRRPQHVLYKWVFVSAISTRGCTQDPPAGQTPGLGVPGIGYLWLAISLLSSSVRDRACHQHAKSLSTSHKSNKSQNQRKQPGSLLKCFARTWWEGASVATNRLATRTLFMQPDSVPQLCEATNSQNSSGLPLPSTSGVHGPGSYFHQLAAALAADSGPCMKHACHSQPHVVYQVPGSSTFQARALRK